jgi:phosphatidylglycerol lysyltransferase
MMSVLPKSDPLADQIRDLQTWGGSSHSILSIYPEISQHRVPGVDGFVPYVETDSLFLVTGEPVSPVGAFGALLSDLKMLADRAGKNFGMLPCRRLDLGAPGLKDMQFREVYIGREPIYNLKALARPSKSTRLAVNRAVRLGLKVVEYDEVFESQLRKLTDRWQESRQLPPMQSLFSLQPLLHRDLKRIYLCLDKNDTVMAFMACAPIYARQGWYLEDLIRSENAPNGTTELLVTNVMARLAEDGFEMATFAIAPLAGLPDVDEEHPWLNKMLKAAYKYLAFAYHFESLEYFKGKFKPAYWENNYFYYTHPSQPLALLNGLLEAFVGESLWFCMRHSMKRKLNSRHK